MSGDALKHPNADTFVCQVGDTSASWAVAAAARYATVAEQVIEVLAKGIAVPSINWTLL